MQAVEFEADAKDGWIRIPEKHKTLNSKHLKLVALYDDTPKPNKKPTSLDSLQRKMLEFFDNHRSYNLNWQQNQMTRDEMNER